jgi:hypothetical protein
MIDVNKKRPDAGTVLLVEQTSHQRYFRRSTIAVYTRSIYVDPDKQADHSITIRITTPAIVIVLDKPEGIDRECEDLFVYHTEHGPLYINSENLHYPNETCAND